MSPAPAGELSPATITVLGPTASGKTALAVALARRLGGAIVSVDSRMVYRELDLGCGKDLAAYGTGPDAVPVLGLDLCGLDHEFSLFDFQRAALEAARSLEQRGLRPILCGGSGLYLDCLLAGYSLVPGPGTPDPALASLPDTELRRCYGQEVAHPHNSTDTEDRERLLRALAIARLTPDSAPRRRGARFHPGLVLGLRPTRDELRRRIRVRLLARLEAGLVEEGRALLEAGHAPERLSRLGLEYRWLVDHLCHGLPEAEFVHGLEMAIRQFARRQWMWFRRMEREGLVIHWLEIPDGAEPAEVALEPALAAVARHTKGLPA